MPRKPIVFERLGKALAGNFVGRIVQVIALLASAVVLGRLLGPQGLGIVAIVTATVRLAVIPAQEGAAKLCERELAGAIGKKHGGQGRAAVRFNILGSALIAVLGSGAVWIFLASNVASDGLGLLAVGIALCFANIGISALRGILRGAGQTVHAVRVANLITITMPLLYLAYWQITGDLTPVEALWLQVAAKLLWAPWAFSMVRQAWAAVVPKVTLGSAAMPIPSGWVAESMQFTLLGIVAVALSQIGVLMLGHLATPEEAGLFRIASRAFLVAGLCTTAAQQAYGPHIARAWQAGDKGGLERPSRIISVLALSFALVAISGFLLVGHPLIILAFGESFAPAYWPSAILILAAVVTSFSAASGRLLKMTGEQRIVFRASLIALCIAVALNFWLIPRFGALGCAISFFVASLVSQALLTFGARRHVGFWPVPNGAAIRAIYTRFAKK